MPRHVHTEGCLRHTPAKPLGQVNGLPILHPGRQDTELLPTQAYQAVLGAQLLCQPVDQTRQQRVPHQMPVGIIDPLEVVDIEQDQVARRGDGTFRHPPIQAAPVQRTGQRIALRGGLCLLLFVLASADVDQHPGQRHRCALLVVLQLRDDLVPYVGLGWRSSHERGLGFFSEVGVMSTDVEVSLSSSKNFENNGTTEGDKFNADLRKEEQRLEDEADELSVYPVAMFGISYTF